MIRLKNILFESVTKETIVSELAKAFYNYNNYLIIEIVEKAKSSQIWAHVPSERELAEYIYEDVDFWDEISKNSEMFKYLGSGAYGVTFDLGDKVLKLDTVEGSFPSKERTEMANKSLWGKKRAGKQTFEKIRAGSSVPMIYDHGNFTLFEYDDPINIFWVIMEKFETQSAGTSVEKWSEVIQRIIDLISMENDDIDTQQKAYGLPPMKIDNKITSIVSTILTTKWLKQGIKVPFKEFVGEMNEELRLASDWLEEFVKDIVKLKMKEEKGEFNTDFHTGNIGIRRKGAEGYFKFFD